ncbi:MAG: TadE family protein [Candidatus Dormiibacterota bacterium]
MRPARRRQRGQSMVEFALVAPVFLLVVFATIDYGQYFGARLSVENAARNGARYAVVEPEASYPTAGSGIVTAVTSASNDASIPTNTDCLWQGTTLSPTTYPPFTFSGTGCIGIWYFELTTNGAPTLCIQWSVVHQAFGSYSGATWTASTPGSGCVEPGTDLVVVGVGYQYNPITPMPTIATSALKTYGETQLLEEQ